MPWPGGGTNAWLSPRWPVAHPVPAREARRGDHAIEGPKLGLPIPKRDPNAALPGPDDLPRVGIMAGLGFAMLGLWDMRARRPLRWAALVGGLRGLDQDRLPALYRPWPEAHPGIACAAGRGGLADRLCRGLFLRPSAAQAACGRIAATPVPLAYSLFLPRRALVFRLLPPFALAGSLGWWMLLRVLCSPIPSSGSAR